MKNDRNLRKFSLKMDFVAQGVHRVDHASEILWKTSRPQRGGKFDFANGIFHPGVTSRRKYLAE